MALVLNGVLLDGTKLVTGPLCSIVGACVRVLFALWASVLLDCGWVCLVDSNFDPALNFQDNSGVPNRISVATHMFR